MNKLITARKGYRKPVKQLVNLFANGGTALEAADRIASNLYGASYGDVGKTLKDYTNSTNIFGLSKANNPFSKMNLAAGPKAMLSTGIGKGVLGAATGLIGSAAFNGLSGGLSSGVGNAIGNIGGTIGGAISAVNPIIGGIVSVGSNLIGGLANRAFVSKLNELKIGEIKLNTANLMNSLYSSTSGRSLLDSYNAGPKALSFSQSDVGSDGWFSNKARDKYRELKRQAEYALKQLIGNLNLAAGNLNLNLVMNQLYNIGALGGLFDVIDPSTAIGYSLYTDKQINDDIKANNKNMTNIFAGTPSGIFAFGGNVQSNGTMWSDKLTHINKGGSHEESPYDGVLVGVDSQNVPNLVEEGEVIYDDYVFSNRLKVPEIKGSKDLSYEDKVLKKYSGMTYANAAKKIEKHSGVEDRPEDSIAKRGFEATLSILAASQEKEREKDKLREMQEAIDNMTPEEFAMLQQLMQASQEAQAQQEAMAQLQLMIPQGMEQMMPQELMVAYGGPIYSLGGLLNNWNPHVEGNTFASGGNTKEEESLFATWWYKYINKAENTAIKKGLPIDYGKIYKDIAGKEGPTNSKQVYEALQNLYNQDPSRFGEYDFWANKEEREALETPTDNTELTIPRTKEEIKEDEIKVEGAEKEVLDYHNEKHPKSKYTDKDWLDLPKETRDKFASEYRDSIKGKDNKVSFDNELSSQRAKEDAISWRAKMKNSYLNLDDIKNRSYDDLLRIASALNKDYKPVDIRTLSDEETKKTIDKLKEDIVTWAKNNPEGTLGALNTRFSAPEYHTKWKKTALDDNVNKENKRPSRWVDSGYNFDNFAKTVAAYNGSLTIGNAEGNYAVDPNFTLGKTIDGKDITSVEDLQNLKFYKDYTKAGVDAINRNNTVKWKYDDQGNIVYEDGTKDDAKFNPEDAALIKAIYLQVGRTKINPNGANVPLFNTDNNGWITFNKDIKTKNGVYNTAADYFQHLRDDGKLGALYLTPERLTSSTLYTLNDKDYYSLADILESTPNWKDYYQVTDAPNLKDGTVVKKLSYKNPITFDRMNSLPEGIKLNGDDSYSYITSTENEPFPKMPSWPYLVGAGLQLASLGHNLLSPIDYSNADALINAGTEAGKYQPVDFLPIGERLKYNPFDINYVANQMRASEQANARALANASNGNVGALMAGLSDNNYKNQLALANAYAQQFNFNNAHRKETAEFNKDTDKFNSEGFLKADMANQDAANRARAMLLEGLKSGYTMRQALEDARSKAINAGISGLANIGLAYALNKYANDLTGWRLKTNPYAISQMEGAAKGGKLKRKKKGLSF